MPVESYLEWGPIRHASAAAQNLHEANTVVDAINDWGTKLHNDRLNYSYFISLYDTKGVGWMVMELESFLHWFWG